MRKVPFRFPGHRFRQFSAKSATCGKFLFVSWATGFGNFPQSPQHAESSFSFPGPPVLAIFRRVRNMRKVPFRFPGHRFRQFSAKSATCGKFLFGQTPFWSDNFSGLRFRRPEAFPGRVVDHRFKGPSFSDSQTVEHNAKPPREPQGAAVWPRRSPRDVQVDAQSTRSGIQGEQCAGASSCTDLDRPSCSLLRSITPLVIISQCKTLHL